MAKRNKTVTEPITEPVVEEVTETTETTETPPEPTEIPIAPGPAQPIVLPKTSATAQTITIEYAIKQEILRLLTQGRPVDAVKYAVIRRYPSEEKSIKEFLS
jgi:hypothetical protein